MLSNFPLGVFEIDPYDDRVFDLFPQNQEAFMPASEYTPDDRELLNYFRYFVLYVNGNSRFIAKNEAPRTGYNRNAELVSLTYPENFPWYIENWLSGHPVYAAMYASYVAATRKDLGVTPEELLPSGFGDNVMQKLGLPPSLYFAYTTELMKKQQEITDTLSKVFAKQKSFAFEFNFRQGYVSHPGNNITPEYHTLKSLLSARLQSLQLYSRCSIVAAEVVQKLHPHLTLIDALDTYDEIYAIDPIYANREHWLADTPFWAWVNTSETEADQPGLFNASGEVYAGKLLTPEIAPASPGCPPEYPSAWARRKAFDMAMQVHSIDRVTSTIVNEYEVTIPAGGGIGLPLNSPYSGALLAQMQAQSPEYGDPPEVSTTTDVTQTTTTTGSTTTTESKIIKAVYEVREYRFGPHLTSPGVVGGIINRPILAVRKKSGQIPADEIANMQTKAESLAKQTLIELWGFLPAWADLYGGTVESYVLIENGPMKNLPYYTFFSQNASIDEIQKFRDYDWVMPYAFDVVVTDNPYTTTTTTTSTTTTTVVTETTETVAELEPTTYTFTDVVEKASLKVSMTLSWVEMPDNATLQLNSSTTIRDPGTYMCYATGIDNVFNWAGTRITLLYTPSIFDPKEDSVQDANSFYSFSDLQTYMYYRAEVATLYSYYDEATEEMVEERGYAGIPTYSLEVWQNLTKELFYPGRTILEYLPSLHTTELLQSIQAIDSYFGVIAGTTFLSQYGSSAPLFPVFQESLVWDTQLNKWGKLSVQHACLTDLTPVNSHKNRRVAPQNFTMHAAMLSPSGQVQLFNDTPQDSQIRYGKVGYHRLGFTNLEELRVWFAKASKGVIQIEPSIEGDAPEVTLIQETPFTNTVSQVAYSSSSARWYNVTIKGQYDIKGIEFVGLKSSRR